MVRSRSWDTADEFALADPAKHLVDALCRQPPPVRSHPDLQRRVPEDAGGPFHGMYLREQRSIDQARVLEQFVICPRGVFVMKMVADRIMLEGEQVEENCKTQPTTGLPQ